MFRKLTIAVVLSAMLQTASTVDAAVELEVEYGPENVWVWAHNTGWSSTAADIVVDLDDDAADVYLDGQWVAKAQYDKNGPVHINVSTSTPSPAINATVTITGETDDRFTIYLQGGPGNDTLENQTGNPSYLWGGDGWDRLIGGDGPDILVGGNDTDYLWGGGDDDFLFGGFVRGLRKQDLETGAFPYFPDWYFKNATKPAFFAADDGTDFLRGEDGDDYLDGGYDGSEYDTLYGGDDADVFVTRYFTLGKTPTQTTTLEKTLYIEDYDDDEGDRKRSVLANPSY